MLTEVVDGIKMVAETITNLKDIYTSVKDGRQYFTNKYPGIKTDVAEMCTELQKTCNAVATASAIITHFRFNASPGVIDNEPTRFNDYFMKYKTSATEARDEILRLKGSCGKIRMHIEKMDDDAGQSIGKRNFLALLGLHDPAKTAQVRNALQNIYNDERELHFMVDGLAESLTKALNDVSGKLCSDGMMDSRNVPTAGRLLNDYAKLFGNLETEARQQANDIQELVDELNT